MAEEEDQNKSIIIEKEDILKDVPLEDFPDMLFRMRNNFPKAVHAHEHVCTLLKRKKKNPDLDMAILAPEGDYKKGIIFFTICDGYFNGSVYSHNEKEKKTLENALAISEKVNFMDHKVCRLTCMTNTSYRSVLPIVTNEEWRRWQDVVLWLPWYCAREVEVNLPKGVDIRDLGPEHASMINELWAQKCPRSNESIIETIDDELIDPGVGVFRDEDLLSWAVLCQHGGIALIQTIDSEKLKGYARAAVQALTHQMGNRLVDVHLNARIQDLPYFM